MIAHGSGDVEFTLHRDHPFRIVGVLARTGTPVDRAIHVSLEGLDAAHEKVLDDPLAAALSAARSRAHDADHDDSARAVTAIFVGLKSRSAALAVQRRIDEFTGEPLTAILPGVTLLEVWELAAVAERTLLAVSVLVVLMGLASMLIALLTSLGERRREMAVLRALGARPWQVFALILGEAAFLTLVGNRVRHRGTRRRPRGRRTVDRATRRARHRANIAVRRGGRHHGAGGCGRRADRLDSRVPDLSPVARRRHDGPHLTRGALTVLMRSLFGILLSVCVSGAAWSAEPRTIAWDELSVKLAAADNPFATLTQDQLIALSDLAAMRDRKARGVALTSEEITIERTASTQLRKDGIDADALLAKRDEIANRKRSAASAVNRSVDGKTVRIPGYVLPLEFSGKQVTQFLLVPWVGACIHTPPPEPNQIVFVKPDKPFEIDGMFQAVWVTGRIAATSSTQSVHIVDGAADVDVGYALRANKVERYKP